MCGQKVEASVPKTICGPCDKIITTPFCTDCGSRGITTIVARNEPATGQKTANPSGNKSLDIQATNKGPLVKTSSFKSLVERSITAWNSLAYATDTEVKGSVLRLSATLRRLNSVDDLFRSRIMFWFFQRRDSFMKETRFMKFDINRLEEYILIPMDDGFVNKKDCFYVSHLWRTREAPDPRGEDFALARQDLSTQSWTYVWIDWTCLPQNASTPAEKEYFNRMLTRTPVLMRECGFEWRYPTFQPRLWILVEVAQYMLNIRTGYAVTDDIKPFINDVLAMKAEGVHQVITRRGYNCSVSRDYRLLIGWLELLIIMTKLVQDVPLKKMILDAVEPPYVGFLEHVDTGIKVDKNTGVVSQGGVTYRFTPLYPVDEDGFPK
ncbi:uncharacterized protein N7496_010197 [Penicillium cataractarum]|uniref:Uncharacterized protein n=1 Tax=Penicillium cataractarum TaxID=2100454 RepID=A0A9W9RSJ0_9EURO|nr:uncharacterized protein N7496_010197 [Penicillium cataractarum]KAJ5364484.1 hypothetical protein N7496_010197 [Penicillium cataractarum]